MGLGALGLGAIAIDGCGGFLPWGKTATLDADDVERLLRELDHVVLQLKALEADPTQFGIKKATKAEADAAHATCIRLLTTLCFMGTYRDVPEALWRNPDIERRLAETLPKIYSTIRAARNHLVEMRNEEAADIDKELERDPGLTMRIMERVDDYAKQIHVPIEQRTYLRTATAQLAGRFRYEGTKEVTSKLTSKYDRNLSVRVSSLGMQADVEAANAGDEKTTPTPLRVRFRTQANDDEIRAATCSQSPKVTLDGEVRRIVLDSDGIRCSSTIRLGDGEIPIHASVQTEPAVGGETIVNVVLYPPDGTNDTDSLTAALNSIAEKMRVNLTSGQSCATTAECGPLHCIEGHCRDPRTVISAPVTSRLGVAGESCRTKDDCDSMLDCKQNVCAPMHDASSAKLITTTGKVAKWGAILLIPPICAVGALVLLQCLFMVIVAGCMYAGGD